MNSTFVGYEELSGSRKGVIHNTFLDPVINSSYPTQPHSLTANYYYYNCATRFVNYEKAVSFCFHFVLFFPLSSSKLYV